MSGKRANFIPDVYKQRKRICTAKDGVNNNNNCVMTNGQAAENSKGSAGSCEDTRSALMLLRSYFPVEKFQDRLPPIVLKHQLYSLSQCKTLVDKELNEMRLNGEICCFHLGAEADDVCLLFKSDYRKHVENICKSCSNESRAVIAKYIVLLLSKHYDMSISKDQLLKEYVSKEEDITELMKMGLLTVRDVGSWWLAIPGAGEFMKSYIRGRKAILMMIKKSKYSVILQQELERRKLPKVAKLGMNYHIRDIIGAELVKCESTTSGPLLKLQE